MRSKRRIGRKRKTLKMRTLKFRGGDFDDPDTKDFMNSKIEALEQKITELEANIPVQIGYKRFFSNDRGMVPIFVNKNINIDNFMNIVDANHLVLFLNAFYYLPNLRGLNIDHFKHSSHITFENKEDQELVKNGNLDALNAKYPGLFVNAPPHNPFAGY
jgi:hypothetical protein